MAALFVGAVDVGIWLIGAQVGLVVPAAGLDFETYRAAAAAWITTGEFYHPYQLSGPYDVWAANPLPILYPPIVLPLMVAFTVLPGVLWWAIPIATLVVGILKQAPSRIALIAVLFAWPSSLIALVTGNPAIWIAAILVLAGSRPAFAPLVLIKPSLLPFAFYRIRERGWWLGVAIVAVIGLAFLPMWRDWVTALLNSRQEANVFYSIQQVPLLAAGLLAGRRAT